jgi:hypothetical protein
MKGFDIYQRLDEMLVEPGWKERIEFTYVGNLPRGFSFRNARYVAPLDGGKCLRLSCGRTMPMLRARSTNRAATHQNEGALCGLPLLYRRSGCLPEYCDGFGISFDETDFETGLRQMVEQYDGLVAAMPAYPHTAERTCANYLDLFDQLIKSREQILASRRLWRNPRLVLRNQLPF